MQPICVPCGRAMYCTKNGVMLRDPDLGESSPGTFYRGDEYTCHLCNAKIITGCSGPWDTPELREAAKEIIAVDGFLSFRW